MKRDVLSENSHNYDKYGGRGITIHEPWLVFDNFLADMVVRPDEKFIERRDNDGSYTPDNCYWATRSEQARNRRSNHRITYNGRTMPLIAWAEEIGLSRLTLRSRLREKWPIERALTEPARKRKKNAIRN